MTPTTVDTEVRSYLADVERCLDDLPEEDRQELLEDLEQHLTEVAAEDEGSLAERLGPPDVYAAELRASAGLPARDATSSTSRATAIRRRVATWLEIPWVRSLRGLLVELRPGWWVLRGYLGVLAVDAVFFRYGVNNSVFPIPSFGGSQAIGLVVVVIAMFVSVQLGRRSREPFLRAVSILANIAGAITFFAVMTAYVGPSSYVEPASFEIGPPGFLVHGDGSPISNVCAYDSKLRPLKNVLLYDQDGRPIVDMAPNKFSNEIMGEVVPPGPSSARDFGNVYPREQMTVDPMTGELRPFACPTLEGSKDEKERKANADPPKAEKRIDD